MIVELMTKIVGFTSAQNLKIPNSRDKYIVYKIGQTIALAEIELYKQICPY